MNVIVNNLVLAALQDPYAHAGCIDQTKIMDLIVGDDITVVSLRILIAWLWLSNLDSTGTKVEQFG